MEKDTRLNVRVPESLRRELKVEAARQGRTIAEVIRGLVGAWLKEAGPVWVVTRPDGERFHIRASAELMSEHYHRPGWNYEEAGGDAE